MNSIEIMNGLKLSDSDFVGDVEELEGTIFVAHDHGYVIGACLADHLQEALDTLADEGRLDQFEVHESDFGGILVVGDPHYESGESGECDAISHLGNFGKPYDIEGLDIVELPAPKFSIIALLKNGGSKIGLRA